MSNQGNEHLPDFKQLTDRVIAPPSKGPFIGIRTNLDEPLEEIENETSKRSNLPS